MSCAPQAPTSGRVNSWRSRRERVNAFAEATGDHQWIHVDVEKAKSGPFGATIAHGYLTLSLLPVIAGGIFTVEGPKMVINYGANKVRFRIRCRWARVSAPTPSSPPSGRPRPG